MSPSRSPSLPRRARLLALALAATAATAAAGGSQPPPPVDRSPGAPAPDSAPGGVVRQLLVRHFAGNTGFTPAGVLAKRPWLTGALAREITRHLAAPRPADEAPPIDGDPFTDGQEPPTAFSVGRATVTGGRAAVAVRFADALRARTVVYRLRREGSAWRVDDLAYEDGATLRGALTSRPPLPPTR